MRNVSIDAASTTRPRSGCAQCGWRAWFAPANLDWHELIEIQSAVEHRHAVQRGQHLFRAGDPLHMLYVLTSGSLKTSMADRDERVQVTGFSMPGELVGIEAIASGSYPCNVVAIEDSRCCGIRYSDLERLGHRIPALQSHLHRAMSREINRDHELMFLLGNLSAEERTAHFLLNLSGRYPLRGGGDELFRLAMSRREIASYLGLEVETISRVMTRLVTRRILEVRGKDIRVIDSKALQNILGEGGPDNGARNHRSTEVCN